MSTTMSPSMSISTSTPSSPQPLTPPPVFPVSSKPSLVNLNVRDVLEKESVDRAKEISKKVNFEIEKKKEELRMLVGERYRDLIDAADTIGVMRNSSVSVFNQLTVLREKFSSFPVQLVNIKTPKEFESNNRLNSAEFEIASELKLSLDVPRQLNVCLDKQQIVPSLHLYLFYEKYLCQNSKQLSWTFLASNSGQTSQEILETMKDSILKACTTAFDNDDESIERIAECLIAKQVLSKLSCQKTLTEYLQQRIDKIHSSLEEKDPNFVIDITSSLKAVHSIFIEPQQYHSAAKKIRKPNVLTGQFGFKFTTKSLESFQRENLKIEEPPRPTVLAELILKQFVHPLKSVLQQCFAKQTFLPDELKTFCDLNQYRSTLLTALNKDSKETQDLMRIVLGTSKTLWSETFHPVFTKKCEQVSQTWVLEIFKFLEQDAFPRFQKLDEQLDLVAFVWKPPTLNVNDKSVYDSELDLKLKLNGLSPFVASLCSELEDHFQELLTDFQYLGDVSLKDHISASLVQEFEQFFKVRVTSCRNLFIGKFCTAISELCCTLWKLLTQNDKLRLRQVLQTKCEECWTVWSEEIILQFNSNLAAKMCDLRPSTVASFMPVAEDFSSPSDGGEAVKASIRVPIQLSHQLHTLIFGFCVDLAKVGPQSIPKAVKETSRLNLGHGIQKIYDALLQNCKTSQSYEEPVETNQPLIPQVAVQLMFDLKFCQWLHSSLSENEGIKTLLSSLQGVIDPFDLDIVIPRMTVNLKKFLFETHLTLGLLFSEESHSFIAQNFKTKQNQSLSLVHHAMSTPLPLLPI